MLHATSSRRQIIVAVLIAFALIGGAIRLWAPNPSLSRDMGNLLLVLWVPAIGNVIAFVLHKIKLRRGAGFEPNQPLTGHLRIELVPLVRATGLQGDTCALVVGTEGFSVRLSRPLADWLTGDQAITVEAQFLRPEMARPVFHAATEFRVVAQNQLVGQGRVLQVIA